MNTEKLASLHNEPITFVETQNVKEGVVCDIYSFDQDDSKDLGIITVSKGFKTPLQEVLNGDKTIECFMSGVGTLTVTNKNGGVEISKFSNSAESREIEVKIGQTMQWEADGNGDLVFYEICYPPYKDGRFKNISG